MLQTPSDPRERPRGLWSLGKPRKPETLPARLERRRLYIVPTSFGFYMGCVLFSILLGSLNNGSNSALLFSLSACAMLSVGLLQTHQRLAGVRVLSVHAYPAHEGAPITVRVSLDHRGARMRRGIVAAMGATERAVDLPPGEPLQVDLTLGSLPRGVHPMGRLLFFCRQPYNIAKAWGWVWPNQSFIIYPRLEPNPPMPSHGKDDSDQARAARVGLHMHHLRDYRAGDALRDIAWKASARQGKLMAREYESQGGGLRTLDWASVAHLPRELALSRLAAWVVQADQQGTMTELVLPTESIGPSQGLAHRHACLTALAKVPSDGIF